MQAEFRTTRNRHESGFLKSCTVGVKERKGTMTRSCGVTLQRCVGPYRKARPRRMISRSSDHHLPSLVNRIFRCAAKESAEFETIALYTTNETAGRLSTDMYKLSNCAYRLSSSRHASPVDSAHPHVLLPLVSHCPSVCQFFHSGNTYFMIPGRPQIEASSIIGGSADNWTDVCALDCVLTTMSLRTVQLTPLTGAQANTSP